MDRSSRRLPRLRGLMVALVAIALSAGVALAARPATAPPDAAADGLDRATEVSGRTVPADVVHPEVPARPTEVADEPVTESAEIDEPDRPMSHGWFVSEAAKAETPAGYDSHGAYVSSIAKGDAGKPSGSTGAGATSQGGTKAAAGQAKAAEAKAAASERKGQGNGSGD